MVTYPCSISRHVAGCRHMWEFRMLCQCWLIPPSTHWTGSGEHGRSHTEMIQMILAHAKEPRPLEALSCPSGAEGHQIPRH